MSGSAIRIRLAITALALACPFVVLPAKADKIRNPTAVFAGLDKITGRIISFEAAIDETVQFGALQITPKVCWTRPATEAPKTDAFVEVDEVALNNDIRRIFTGWMFSASPGLHGVEHAVYDVWLTDCKGGTEVVAEPKDIPATPAPAPAPVSAPPAEPRRPARAPDDGGRIDVQPPQGQPVRPRQAPTRRYYPTDDDRNIILLDSTRNR